MPGFLLGYGAQQKRSYVGLHINLGSEYQEHNKQLFDILFAAKDKIESEFGHKLEWERGDSKVGCEIYFDIQGGYRSDEQDWPNLHEQMVTAMIRLEQTFRHYLKRMMA